MPSRRFLIAALSFVSCVVPFIVPQNGMSQDNVSEMIVENGPASVEIWANQRSNALSSGFLHTMQQGGFLTREFFDEMLDGHPALGGMGLQVGWSKRFTTKPLKDGPWALSLASGSELLVSTLWRRDLLELAFVGNAHSLGDQQVFSGTGMRMGAFNRLSFGIEHSETRQRFELSVVQRLAGAEWGIMRGGFWVSESADSMAVDMQAYGAASLDSLPGTGGFSFNQVLPSYGVGLSGSLPWSSETLPVQFVVNFQDVGVLFERPGGMYGFVDTGFVTTGLRVPFSSYFNQSGEEMDDLTWQDVVEGNTGISGDSLVFVTDSASRRTLLLPSRIDAELNWWPSEFWQIRGQVHAGAWMPQPQWTAGFGWAPSDRISVGADVRMGGWGGIRPVTWMQLRVSKRRVLAIEVEDPVGFFWGSSAAQNTYGRGLRFAIRRVPGQGWRRTAKWPDPSVSREAIDDGSIFGTPKVSP